MNSFAIMNAGRAPYNPRMYSIVTNLQRALYDDLADKTAIQNIVQNFCESGQMLNMKIQVDNTLQDDIDAAIDYLELLFQALKFDRIKFSVISLP